LGKKTGAFFFKTEVGIVFMEINLEACARNGREKYGTLDLLKNLPEGRR
jgi:hypothetical protein